jgi:hypothetical protein
VTVRAVGGRVADVLVIDEYCRVVIQTKK